jgi:hypothetical protein
MTKSYKFILGLKKFRPVRLYYTKNTISLVGRNKAVRALARTGVSGELAGNATTRYAWVVLFRPTPMEIMLFDDSIKKLIVQVEKFGILYRRSKVVDTFFTKNTNTRCSSFFSLAEAIPDKSRYFC